MITKWRLISLYFLPFLACRKRDHRTSIKRTAIAGVVYTTAVSTAPFQLVSRHYVNPSRTIRGRSFRTNKTGAGTFRRALYFPRSAWLARTLRTLSTATGPTVSLLRRLVNTVFRLIREWTGRTVNQFGHIENPFSGRVPHILSFDPGFGFVIIRGIRERNNDASDDRRRNSRRGINIRLIFSSPRTKRVIEKVGLNAARYGVSDVSRLIRQRVSVHGSVLNGYSS